MIFILILSILLSTFGGAVALSPKKVYAEEEQPAVVRWHSEPSEGIYYAPLSARVYPTSETGLTTFKWDYVGSAENYISPQPETGGEDETYIIDFINQNSQILLPAESIYFQVVFLPTNNDYYLFYLVNNSVNNSRYNLSNFYNQIVNTDQNPTAQIKSYGQIYTKTTAATVEDRYIQLNESLPIYMGELYEAYSLMPYRYVELDGVFAYGSIIGAANMDEDEEQSILPAGIYHAEQNFYDLTLWEEYNSETLEESPVFQWCSSGETFADYNIITKSDQKITYRYDENYFYSVTTYSSYNAENVDTFIFFDNYYEGSYFQFDNWGSNINNADLRAYCVCSFYNPTPAPAPVPVQKTFWQRVGEAFSGLWGAIKSVGSFIYQYWIKPVWDFLSGIKLKERIEKIIDVAKRITESIADTAEKIIDSIGDVVGQLPILIDKVVKSPISWISIIILIIAAVVIIFAVEKNKRGR